MVIKRNLGKEGPGMSAIGYGAMSEAVSAGKVKFLGLSTGTADQLVAAHKVHPIAAVQYEYLLWRRDAETDSLPTLRDLGIALLPWAPLGSGFLTGTIRDLPADDFRNNNPRYQGENFQTNKERFAPLIKVAEELSITPAQLALAWLLHQAKISPPYPVGANRAASPKTPPRPRLL
ncbi:MAG: aldo/keto reductase [Desulfobacterales bacterium]|jgi:aryl-alcohol dehydrogenase-like predicted oxidoreductase